MVLTRLDLLEQLELQFHLLLETNLNTFTFADFFVTFEVFQVVDDLHDLCFHGVPVLLLLGISAHLLVSLILPDVGLVSFRILVTIA